MEEYDASVKEKGSVYQGPEDRLGLSAETDTDSNNKRAFYLLSVERSFTVILCRGVHNAPVRVHRYGVVCIIVSFSCK